MSPVKRHVVGPLIVDPAEWDFSIINDDEVVACWEWEFWRELLNSKESGNTLIRENAIIASERLEAYKLEQRGAKGERLAVFWLATPFLKLPPDRMVHYQMWKKLVYPQLMGGSPEVFQNSDGIPFDSYSDLAKHLNEEGDKIRPEADQDGPFNGEHSYRDVFGEWDETLCGPKPSCFLVHWSRDDGTLLREFEQFLKKSRNGRLPVEDILETRGSKFSTERSELVGLGILRLSRHFKVLDMRWYVARVKGIGFETTFGIGDDSALSRTKGNARKVLVSGLIRKVKSLHQ
jgi:hypothetical protein